MPKHNLSEKTETEHLLNYELCEKWLQALDSDAHGFTRPAFSLLFYELSQLEPPIQEAGAAQPDAFWLLHLFRHGNIEKASAERSAKRGYVIIEPSEEGFKPVVRLSEKGLNIITRSLADRGVLEKLFPSIENVKLRAEQAGLPYAYYVNAFYKEPTEETYFAVLEDLNAWEGNHEAQ